MLFPQRHMQNIPPQPRALRSFLNIKRYWDKQHDTWAAKILPGEFYVTLKDELITTVLGSCVSACVRDRALGIGGMNHFMLPLKKGNRQDSWSKGDWAGEETRYGNFAMERLINEILKNGGRRDRLEIKIFGGGRIISFMHNDVGKGNIDFVRDYIKTEGINLLAEDVGGTHPRKVIYYPATGRARVKKLIEMHNNTLEQREEKYSKEIREEPVAGDIELF